MFWLIEVVGGCTLVAGFVGFLFDLRSTSTGNNDASPQSIKTFSNFFKKGQTYYYNKRDLIELKKELNLGGSDIADPKTFAEKGGLAGADFLLLGKVSDYTYKENTSNKLEFVAGSGLQEVLNYEYVGEVRVDIRLVNVKTGEAVRSASGHGTARNTGHVTYQAEWNHYVGTEGQATLSNLNTLLTDASHSAISDAVRKLNGMYAELVGFHSNQSLRADLSKIGSGKILADIGQGQYIIGVQTTSSLRAGDRFRVQSEVPIKNSKGQILGGIGVSGASKEDDAACAQAGLDAVKAMLK